MEDAAPEASPGGKVTPSSITSGGKRIPKRTQYLFLLLLCAGGIGTAGVLHLAGSPAFRPYFGDLNPLLATISVVLLGVVSLAYLHSRRWFDIHRRGDKRSELPLSASFAALLALPVIIVDLFGAFSEGVNVMLPQSLLFYPLMALVAELVFHAVPLSLLLALLDPIAKSIGREKTLWSCILLVSFIEPVFQVTTGSEESPLWANAYVGLHVFAINLFGLYLFKHYDFLAMYLFRVMYYLHWHILWGHLRLHILF